MVGSLLSLWECPFSRAFLNFQGVFSCSISLYLIITCCCWCKRVLHVQWVEYPMFERVSCIQLTGLQVGLLDFWVSSAVPVKVIFSNHLGSGHIKRRLIWSSFVQVPPITIPKTNVAPEKSDPSFLEIQFSELWNAACFREAIHLHLVWLETS